jgi:hypothetical protein
MTPVDVNCKHACPMNVQMLSNERRGFVATRKWSFPGTESVLLKRSPFVSVVSRDAFASVCCVNLSCTAIDTLHSFLEIWWPTKEMKADILQKFLKRLIFSTLKAVEDNFTSLRNLITKIDAFSSFPLLFSSDYTTEVLRLAINVSWRRGTV